MSRKADLNHISSSRIAAADAVSKRTARVETHGDVFDQGVSLTHIGHASAESKAKEERTAARSLVRVLMGGHACHEPSCGDRHLIGGHGCAGPGCALPGHREAAEAARWLLDGFRFDLGTAA